MCLFFEILLDLIIWLTFTYINRPVSFFVINTFVCYLQRRVVISQVSELHTYIFSSRSY